MKFILPFTLICLFTLSLCTQAPKPADVAQTLPPPVNPDTISRDTAMAWMKRWGVTSNSIDTLIDRAGKKPGKKNPLDKFVVKGFFIPMGELNKIVAAHAKDSIWAMLVVKPDLKNKSKYETGLIFMTYRKDGNKSAASSGQFTYYDFTEPCPDECPPNDQ